MKFSEITTIQVGGEIEKFIPITNRTEFLETIKTLQNEQVLIVGGGSNILPNDGDYSKTVIKLGVAGGDDSFSKNISTDKTCENDNFCQLFCGWAGLMFDDVTKFLGANELAGIPGSLGGAIVQNSGAYGLEIADFIEYVEAYDMQDKDVKVFLKAECGFEYRNSLFKRNSRYVILDAGLMPYKSIAKSNAESRKTRDEILELRASKGMLELGYPAGNAEDKDRISCGSFFTNPIISATQYAQIIANLSSNPNQEVPHWEVGNSVKLSAAWLIENAGFPKGFKAKGHQTASLSSKHTLALTNAHPSPTSGKELRELASTIIAGVYDKFKIVLEPEPIML